MIEAYPLQWPVGYPRTNKPLLSRFERRTLTVTTQAVRKAIKALEGSDLIINTNIPLRNDGMPRADYQKRAISDKGVAVYFNRNGKQVVLACDKWDTIEDNLWAIALSIEAMRGLDRWGVSDIIERSFTGFAAIPERVPGENCWDILLISQTRDTELINHHFKMRAKVLHPDAPNGSKEAFQKLQEARDQALTFAKSNEL